jgi:hypothetical protein
VSVPLTWLVGSSILRRTQVLRFCAPTAFIRKLIDLVLTPNRSETACTVTLPRAFLSAASSVTSEQPESQAACPSASRDLRCHPGVLQPRKRSQSEATDPGPTLSRRMLQRA